jgi:hypothetical protein
MFCAVMAAVVLIPSAVYAVDTFSNVAIQDPTTGVKAKVLNGGQLRVSDGNGALTVDGSVTARDAQPADLIHFLDSGAGSSTCTVVASPPAGKAWIVTSLSVNIVNNGGNALGPDQYVVVYSTTTCSYPYFAVMTPTAVGPHNFSLEPGIAIPNGGAVAVELYGTDLQWSLTGEGYQVPAASVPAVPPSSPAAPAGTRNSPDQ